MGTRKLSIRLGNSCNLSCPHCHRNRLEFSFDKEIIPHIKEKYVDYGIRFSGGEPLLYMDVIRKLLQALGKDFDYGLVTNGTLLTEEIVDIFNAYDVNTIVSFDGFSGDRDYSNVRFDLLGRIKRHGMACLTYKGNMDFGKISNDIAILKKRYKLFDSFPANGFIPNFLHETTNTNVEVTEEMLVEYVKQKIKNLEIELILQKGEANLQYYPYSRHFVELFKESKYPATVRCCNPEHINMTLDGRFLLCPYGSRFIGDIKTGIDWKKVADEIPGRCKNCTLWNRCKNYCVANVTNHECYITKVLYKNFKSLLEKYGLTYEEFAEKFQNGGDGYGI